MAGKLNIIASTRAYEKWLKRELGGDIVKHDLDEKHAKMAKDAFQFLRATYWRWAESIFTACPALKKRAPQVLAVGDIHVENFGTWRDTEGRLVWGVNDFDEAARMPYWVDLVRLATSAVLAPAHRMTPRAICASILKGYKEGIADPKPHVLDRDNEWLRDEVVVTDKERDAFWKDYDPIQIREKAKKEKKKKRPKLSPVRAMRPPYKKALERARPDNSVAFAYFERSAGTGSLGRPRFVGIGDWHGDRIIREAKAIVRPGWSLAHGGSRNLRCEEIANGTYRSPDPFYHLDGHVLVRRLSPNDRKIEAKPKVAKDETDAGRSLPASRLVTAEMLQAMGRELAAIHRGTPNCKKAIMTDLSQGKPGWLLVAVTAAKKLIQDEQKEWQAEYKRRAGEKD